MRQLLYVTIGFALACMLAAYDVLGNLLIPAIIGCGMIFALVLLLSLKYKALTRGALILLGCTIGFGYFFLYQNLYLQGAAELDGGTWNVTITATDYSEDTDYGSGLEGKVEWDGKTYPVYVYLNEHISVYPGDRIHGEFRFRLTTAQSIQGETYHQGRGIFLLAYAKGQVNHRASWGQSPLRYPAILRKNITNRLSEAFPQDVFPFVQALFLGDTEDLSYVQHTDFQRSGVSHIVSVSGLHISILYGLISTVTFRKRYLTAIIALPVLGLFAAVVGFTPSVTRACLMTGLMILAQVFNREYDGATALSFACLIMMLINPMVVTNVGCQLSVSCVAGILLFQKPIYDWLEQKFGSSKGKGLIPRMKRECFRGVSVSLSAVLLTMPLTGIYFGSVSIIGLFANLLTLWLFNLVFCGIGIAVLLSLIYIPLAGMLGWILAWPIRFALKAVHLLARFPLAAVYTESLFVILWLVLVYVLLAVFLLLKRKKTRWFVVSGLAGLCLSLLLSWVIPGMSGQCLTMLDVGQGQCLILEAEGSTFLVDCGGDSDRSAADMALRTLYSRGITKLDGVILTHMDQDHVGGAMLLLQWMETDYLMYPATEDPSDIQQLENLKADTLLPLTKDWSQHGDGFDIQVFYPGSGQNENENSLWILFCGEKYDILITGDATQRTEKQLLKRVDLPYVDVLIAGHHGDENSTSWELLQEVSPNTVLISVGQDNRFGHPEAELLDRLNRFGCEVYRTDQCGTITYKGE